MPESIYTTATLPARTSEGSRRHLTSATTTNQLMLAQRHPFLDFFLLLSAFPLRQHFIPVFAGAAEATGTGDAGAASVSEAISSGVRVPPDASFAKISGETSTMGAAELKPGPGLATRLPNLSTYWMELPSTYWMELPSSFSPGPQPTSRKPRQTFFHASDHVVHLPWLKTSKVFARLGVRCVCLCVWTIK